MLRETDVSVTCCIGGALSRRATVGLQRSARDWATGLIVMAVARTGEAGRDAESTDTHPAQWQG